MSKKPLKASNQIKLNSLMERKKKKDFESLESLPPYTYIVSEGTKTEPYYISGFADTINKKYYNYTSSNRIKVKGTGRSTKGLLEYARMTVEKDMPQATIVWLMYDRDDFPYDDFDNTQFSAESKKDKRQYKVAWSNECIELWFVLHLQNLVSDIGRENYKKILEEAFGYEKNCEDTFNVLKDNTEIAIQRAKKQYYEFGDLPPSKRCPATRVFELVEELKKYL